MNFVEFESLVNTRTDAIKKTLGKKAVEYAFGDRLYNFKRAAEIARTTPAQALFGMFSKHLVSVIDMVEGTRPATDAVIDEKIGDAINYLILLEAVLKEKKS